ncbi:MAG: glycosyltransferase [Caulobacteraceae bacterium]|nr:glycosyltransferase [Caulobacteraceae bacterium]
MKQARTALSSGNFDAVHILAKKGRGDDGLALQETIEPGLTLERIAVPRVVPGLNLLLWLGRAAGRSVTARPDVVSVHHVTLLPLGALVKALTGARLVYDAHELETESASLVHRPLLKAVCKVLEAVFLRFYDQAIVVNEPIADWYRARYRRLPITAIHNYPRAGGRPAGHENCLRLLHDIPDDKVVFIYQGVISADRGLPLLLDVFTRGMVPNGVFVAMGYGDMVDDVREAASRSPHVKYQPAVPQDEIVAYTASADVGLCLVEAICLSYELSLPNKLFEYVQAGLPVLVGNPLPEMAGLVTRLGLGMTTDLDIASMTAALNRMAEADSSPMKAAAAEAATQFIWENEEPRLAQVYAGLVETRDARAGNAP